MSRTKKTAIEPNMIYTLTEFAEIMKLSDRTLAKVANKGRIKCGRGSSKVGFRFTGRSILEWVDDGMPGIAEGEKEASAEGDPVVESVPSATQKADAVVVLESAEVPG